MSKEDLTQEKVNDLFKAVKLEWDNAVAESGRTEKMFIIMDRSGLVSNFMLNYKEAKDHIESLGLEVPFEIEGLTITFNQE